MLKARLGSGLILFGLTEENLQRLRQEKSIRIDGAELGLAGLQFGIFWARDGAGLASVLRKNGVEIPEAMAVQLALNHPSESDHRGLRVCTHCGGVVVEETPFD